MNDNRNGMTFVPSQGNCFCWTGVSQTKPYATLEFAFINTCSEIMVEASTTTSTTTTTTTTVTTTTAEPSMVNQWNCDWQDQTDGVIVSGVTNDQFTGSGLTKSKCVQVTNVF